MIKYNSPREYLGNVFTTAPRSFEWGEAVVWGVCGVGVALLFAALPVLLRLRRRTPEERKRFFRGRRFRIAAALAVLCGAVLGVGSYALGRNAVENLGDFYVKDSGGIAGYEDIFGGAVRPAADAPPIDYVIYIPGAINGKREMADLVNTGTKIIVPYGHGAAIVRFARTLRPCDRLHLIGFSRGGEGVLEVASRIDRPVETLVSLDPIGFSLFNLRSRWRSYRKPDNVRHFLAIGAVDYNDPRDPGVVAIGNGKYLTEPLIGTIPVEYVQRTGHGHSMLESGWRFPENPTGLERIFSKIRSEFYPAETPVPR